MAFSAYATSDQQPNNGDGVAFSGLITNAGSHYDGSTSRFTCPVTAYYYFYFSLYVHVDNPENVDCGIEIVLDGNLEAEVRSKIYYTKHVTLCK